MRPALLICNPRSGGREWSGVLPRIQDALAEAGFAITLRETEAAGHGHHLAREAAVAGSWDAIFGLGGDGTLREIASGLLGSPIPLAILPGGTTNVLATCLDVPADAVAASGCYDGTEDLRTVDFDVGLCGDQPFLMMVSAGIDAMVLSKATQDAKKRWGRLAVGGQALSALREYTFPRFTLTSADQQVEGSFAIVSNVPFYGGAFRMTPLASFQDGVLDLGVFHGSGVASTLAFALDVARGKHDRRDDVDLWQAPTAHLDSDTDAPAQIQIDGDPVEMRLPLEISIAADRLKVLLPADPLADQSGLGRGRDGAGPHEVPAQITLEAGVDLGVDPGGEASQHRGQGLSPGHRLQGFGGVATGAADVGLPRGLAKRHRPHRHVRHPGHRTREEAELLAQHGLVRERLSLPRRVGLRNQDVGAEVDVTDRPRAPGRRQHDLPRLGGEVGDLHHVLDRLVGLADDEVELQLREAGVEDHADLVQQHGVGHPASPSWPATHRPRSPAPA